MTTLTTLQIADMATKFMDADLVEYVGSYDTFDYTRRMLTATAETALWADASHEDDTEGTGKYQREIDELRLGYSPEYESALPPDTLAELTSDVEGFVAMAWPYLAVDGISPEQAGNNFELSRNGNGTGFWDRGYKHGDDLHDLAELFGTFGLEVAGHGDDIRVTGHHG